MSDIDDEVMASKDALFYAGCQTTNSGTPQTTRIRTQGLN